MLYNPPDGRFLPLVGGGRNSQLGAFENEFMENYILQASVGDLPGAAEGFDALVRSRRGDPWTRDTAITAKVATPAEILRDDNMRKLGGGGDNRGKGLVPPDALEVFVERHEDVVREFSARAASNFAFANSEVSSAGSRARYNSSQSVSWKVLQQTESLCKDEKKLGGFLGPWGFLCRSSHIGMYLLSLLGLQSCTGAGHGRAPEKNLERRYAKYAKLATCLRTKERASSDTLGCTFNYKSAASPVTKRRRFFGKRCV